MYGEQVFRLFFLINPRSGHQEGSLEKRIRDFFQDRHSIYLYILTENCQISSIQEEMQAYHPDRFVAVGGDGTVKLAAECLLGTEIPLAIIPMGSANGLAKEIQLKPDFPAALDLIQRGIPKAIHALRINQELSIHLADIGLNARIVKKFESLDHRGMIGYAKATWQALKRRKRMHVMVSSNGNVRTRKAEMVVIANGTSYGTGVKINKSGSLFDQQFEIILIKGLSLIELLKMSIRFKTKFNPYKTEVIHAQSVHISIREKSALQIDGEYLGKVKDINIKLIPRAIFLLIPPSSG